MKRITVLCGVIVALIGVGHAREFTSVDGKKIKAEVVSVTDSTVVIKRGIKQFNVPLDKLSQDDQVYLAEWRMTQQLNLIPKLDVDVSTGKSNRSDKRDDFDDRIGSFQFTVKITNNENGFDLKDAKGVVSVLGEDCDADDTYSVMQQSNFKVDIAEGETFEWKGEEKRYKFDDRPPAYWGHQYHGYIFQLKNANDKVIYTKVIPTKFEAGVEKILGIGANQSFDKEFRAQGRASIYDP